MIEVKSAFVTGDLEIEPYKKDGKVVKGVYSHVRKIVLYGTLVYHGVVCSYFFNVDSGYVGNFASSPDLWLVQKVVPSYIASDPVYDSGFDLHDWLYSTQGKTTTGEKLTRKEVDQLARGIMEISLKKSKKKFAWLRAAIMYEKVRLFAGGKSHWGNDTFKSKDMATFRLMPVARE